MPIYQIRCKGCSEKSQIFRRVADYDDVPTCDICGSAQERMVCAPYVRREEITPYRSPTTGKVITSTSERARDLKESGCIPWEPSIKDHVRKRRESIQQESIKAVDDCIDNTVRDLNNCGRLA